MFLRFMKDAHKIATYRDHIFSRYQRGFRKGYSAQDGLLATTEKWKKCRKPGCFWSTIG